MNVEDIIRRLKNLRYVGQLYPVDRNSVEPPIIGLLVPFTNALDEVKLVEPECTSSQLKALLKTADIHVFNSIDEFVKLKEKVKKSTIPTKLVKVYKTRLEEIADALEISKGKIRYNHELDQVVMEGKNGFLYTDGPTWYISTLPAKSKRQWSSIKSRLSFMVLLNDGDLEGRFSSQSMLMPEEAKIVRKVVGFKKIPALC